LVPKLAAALSRLGTRRSWIVNGYDKLDEISMTGHTTVSDVTGNSIATFEVTARDIGIGGFAGDLPSGCTAQESANVIRAILDNRMKHRDAEKLVLLNAAAAIYVTGKAADLKTAYSTALESVRSGSAALKLADLSQLLAK
jgi:anthranilate phosphoribosyltransferase